MSSPETMDQFKQQLIADGVIGDDATLQPLTGGVSSEIYRVDDRGRTFVVKRALAQLRVKDAWFADISRNRFERAYFQVVGALLPGGAVPRLIDVPEGRGYFAMEFLGAQMTDWKRLMLAGRCEVGHAQRAGAVLGEIHARTWEDAAIAQRFDTTANFHELRTSPYLLTTGQRNPRFQALFEAQAQRVEARRLALVHGDYSPKNLMIGADRLVVLDCECAWFGDPSFDAAFLLNHLVLKALHLSEHRDTLLAMARQAWACYAEAVGPQRAAVVAQPLPGLLPMLMLARVDGKSPLEYLSAAHGQVVKAFVVTQLQHPAASLSALFDAWENHLKSQHEVNA